MNNTIRDFVIGLCSIAAFIGLAILLIRFGEIKTTSQYGLEIQSLTASGLRAGSTVTLNGVKIGTINSITNSNNPRWPVLIRVGINESHVVPQNAVPYATSSLLGTGSSLELSVKPSEVSAPPLPMDGTAKLPGPVRNMMLTRINEALDERLEPVLGSMQDLSETYTTLGIGLIAMVGNENEDSDEPTVRSTLSRINGALTLVELWLDNDEARQSMHEMMGTSIIFVNKGIDLVQELTELTRNVDVRSAELLDELVPVASELTKMFATSERLLEEIRTGEGTLGQLVQNPDVYNSLEASMMQLEEAIISFRLLMDQIREEGVF